MAIRTKLILLLVSLLLLAVVPISWFTLKVTPFRVGSPNRPQIERTLETAIDNAKNLKEQEEAVKALKEYRQLEALRKPIRTEFIVFIVLLTSALLISAILIGSFFIVGITKPLRELTSATKKIASGDTSVRLKEKAPKEIAVLMESFNKMGDALLESRRRLKIAERHAAWQEMAKVMAHEIKNPLTPIRLFTQRLREKGRGDDEFSKTLEKSTKIILEEIDTLNHLVDNFSKFARIPPRSPQLTDIDGLVKSALALYSNLPNIKFKESYSRIQEIPVDQTQIREAIGNVIKNGVEAIGDTEGIIEVETLLIGEKVGIIITDNGKGIPKQSLQRVFHPYFSSKKEGSGLGLSIAERIINDHGGTISIKSKEGKGTKVTIKLPI